ncbi:EpsI family protein [Desulfonatronum thiosulfatophilum]|uniref:EpsI family protein n=1 Tax=Desulfonatronum thiosulfatophilum TaxID=617002 RepID=A0A1G6EKQ9_9BACT|nr:exosortase C-terminal domain/associated protein EpsI [Desulfonatronum thiosulfatophilum]SDB57978.1 EpsI family protein [Desulfonatronum thiosulfatophilum]
MLNTKRFILLYALLLLTMLYLHVHAATTPPINKPFHQFPTHHADWKMVSSYDFSDNVMEILKPTDILNRTYIRKGERPVDLHIGYYDGGKGTGVIHSPKHCLPGGGWQVISSERLTMTIGTENVNMVQAVYQLGETREVFLYWFQTRDRSLNNEYSLKLAEVTGSLLHGRRDTAFIRISTRYDGDLEQGLRRTRDFASDFYPVIREFLPS